MVLVETFNVNFVDFEAGRGSRPALRGPVAFRVARAIGLGLL